MFQTIDKLISNYDFSNWGWTPLSKPISLEFYKSWIEESYHGEMGYLKSHIAAKETPQILLPNAHSAIVLTRNYFPHPKPVSTPIPTLRTSIYSQGEDYHHWFKQEIHKLAQNLKLQFPNEEFLAFTDSSPVLERDLAARAGIGWVGKNTCLINRQQGSLFFIGELFTTLKLDNDTFSLPPDLCGKCTRCIDICPTDAIIEPKKLDANLCISYLTIEAKSLPANELRPKIGDWLFGCDLCQTVCPWNEKSFGKPAMAELTNTPDSPPDNSIYEELKWILTSSNKSLQKVFRGTALSRATGVQLKRNAIVVATNLNLEKLVPQIAIYKEHERLGELALWAIDKLSGNQNSR